jgi:hypothetical protein
VPIEDNLTNDKNISPKADAGLFGWAAIQTGSFK